MAFRTVILSNPAHLQVQHSQLVITTDESSVPIPLEDICVIGLEHPAISFSSGTLQRITEEGCVVIFSDGRHLPSAVLTPSFQHSRMSNRIILQTSLSKPLKKQLWKRIVQQKISNQSHVVFSSDSNENTAHLISSLVSQVLSGDSTNREGYAARLYFPALFGAQFTRSDDSIINAGLNYGYAIVRSHICRSLAYHGFTPSMGINHKSELNMFNLADDIIEPFRPIVDAIILNKLITTDEKNLNSEIKRCIIENVIESTFTIRSQQYPLVAAVQQTVLSLLTAMTQEDPTLLQLPTM